MNSKKKKYWEMSTRELAEATKEFDREDVAETFREMTPAEEAAWRVATDRTVRGRGARRVRVISLGITADLLKRADALAKKRRVSRDRLVAEGLEAVLAKSHKA